MVPQGVVQVLGRPPFNDTQLTVSGELSYLGGNWDRDIAFAGYSIPLQVSQAFKGANAHAHSLTQLVLRLSLRA